MADPELELSWGPVFLSLTLPTFLHFTILSFFFLFSDLLLSYWYCFDGETRSRNVLEETKEFCIALN